MITTLIVGGLALLLGLVLGVFGLLGFMITRMLGSDGWDKSNIINALRLIWHAMIHPEDFGKMYYLTGTQYDAAMHFAETKGLSRPFYYISKDELSEVVRTRP